MMLSKSAPERARWNGTVLLFCGASHMGKSFLARAVMVEEYGAVYRQIDNVYTIAVNDALMVVSSLNGTVTKAERRQAEKDARRRARDRKWPNDETKARFFAAYSKEIRGACREGFAKRAPIVFEGGSLRDGQEVEIAMQCARRIYGSKALLVRVHVEVPYGRWLENRVRRMLKANVESATLDILSVEKYRAEVEAARPQANVNVIDRMVSDAESLRRLMAELTRNLDERYDGAGAQCLPLAPTTAQTFSRAMTASTG